MCLGQLRRLPNDPVWLMLRNSSWINESHKTHKYRQDTVAYECINLEDVMMIHIEIGFFFHAQENSRCLRPFHVMRIAPNKTLSFLRPSNSLQATLERLKGGKTSNHID